MTALARPSRAIRIGLATLAWFTMISALVGMCGLTLAGGMGLPSEWLDATPFSSWAIPGVLLGVLVGGSQALTLLARFRRLRIGWGLHAAAGLILLIWIFVELAIVLEWSPLHAIFFATGLAQVTLALLALGAWTHPFLARDPNTNRNHTSQSRARANGYGTGAGDGAGAGAGAGA